MSASLYINGHTIDVVGDGMAPNTVAGAVARDARFPSCFGGFGFVTFEGDTVADCDVSDVAEVLAGIYAGQADPDEESQG